MHTLLLQALSCTNTALYAHCQRYRAMRSHAMLLVIAAAAALTPLPPGINAYEVAAGTEIARRSFSTVAPSPAIAAYREANVNLGEIKFSALLGERRPRRF